MNEILALIQTLLRADTWWTFLLSSALLLLLAYGVKRLSRPIANRLVRLTPVARRAGRVRSERVKTLQTLVASIISFSALLVAFAGILILLDVSTNTIVWVVGLFAAAFGLGARPLVSDFLTGIGFLFEDPYDIGEKVELAPNVQGVVERVGIRTTELRAHTGEIYTIPNGEVRLIRNFSRGRFSLSEVTLHVKSADLERAIAVLDQINQRSVESLPNLLEPWQLISKTGQLGEVTELTLVTKARFGRAADMRPNLLAFVQRQLAQEQIELAR